jgi:diaminopimelate epimerase
MSSTARLTKHHGLGNDFLVWIGGDLTLGPALALRWCDRHRGIGADGLLLAESITEREWRMALFNADGSRAEMSGNGIRCFAQAVADGAEGTFTIVTDAGVRTVEVTSTTDPHTIMASVDMGFVHTGRPSSNWASVGAHPDRPVGHFDLGNPHTVVGVEDVHSIDLAAIGRQVPDVNLEIVAPGPEPRAITMRVHERGAGITEACGTGACASAWAAASWGLVASNTPEVLVHMDGGDATVRLHSPDQGRVTLIGPATFIAAVELPL